MSLGLDDTHGSQLSPEVSAVVPPAEMSGTVTVHRRELTLVLERLFMAAGVPRGAWTGARDFAVDCVDAYGTAALRRFAELLAPHPDGPADPAARWAAPECTGTGADGRGASALVNGAFIVGAALGQPPGATVHVRGSADAPYLAAGALWAAECGRGLHVEAEAAADTAAVTVLAAPDPPLPRRIGFGLPVDASVWWPLYFASNRALSPDTDASRLHTGAAAPPSGLR